MAVPKTRKSGVCELTGNETTLILNAIDAVKSDLKDDVHSLTKKVDDNYALLNSKIDEKYHELDKKMSSNAAEILSGQKDMKRIIWAAVVPVGVAFITLAVTLALKLASL